MNSRRCGIFFLEFSSGPLNFLFLSLVVFLFWRPCLSLPYSTPFYMYNSSEWMMLIEGCEGSDPRLPSDHAVHFESEYSAIRQLRDHPWRVFEPEEALIFVVPLMLGTASRGRCRLSHDQIAKKATTLLMNSEYFKRYKGSDHLLINTDWKVRDVKSPLSLAFKNVIFGIQEHYKNNRKFHVERCDISVPYGGWYDYKDSIVPAAPPGGYEEFMSKKYNTFFVGRIGKNWAYADRYHGFLHSKDADIHYSHVFATTSNCKC